MTRLQIVLPEDKPTPRLSAASHARLRHTDALWHPDHVDEVLRKTSPRLPFTHKSKFHSYEIALEAVERSAEYPATVSANGHLSTTFDLAYQTGIDYRTNESVTSVTVVTDADGEVVTVYPGTPW